MHPDHIGPYIIDRKIGAGGMGTVYHAQHQETGDEVAVKVLPASLAREEGFIARFVREINALKKLDNPHVVRLIDQGVEDETYYYVMEYIDGETLTSRLRREKRIGWDTCINFSVQICSALKAAHDAGIVHRDLKPSNLMITSDNTIKLTDFGIAQVFAGTRLTASGGVVGTAEYMSPEQAQGKRATKKSDLYSLGAVMYVMLTGRPPFSGKTTVEVMQKHRYGQFDRPSRFAPGMPHWLDEIVCKLLEKEPDERFADAYVLSRRLNSVLKKVQLSADAPTLARPETPASNDSDDTLEIASEVSQERERHAAGHGTLVRDLVRAEIENENAKGPVAALFDNVWFLMFLFVAVIAGTFYWLQNAELTDEQKFQAAVEILSQPESKEWITAGSEYLEPLLESDSEQWQEQVTPLLKKIQSYENRRRLTGRRFRTKNINAANEAERFLLIAQNDIEIGDLAQAERRLQALCAVLAHNEDYAEWYKIALKKLESVRQQQIADESRHSILESSIERARAMLANGKQAEAAVVLSGIIELYGSDPGASSAVKQARQLLRESRKSP